MQGLYIQGSQAEVEQLMPLCTGQSSNDKTMLTEHISLPLEVL